LYAHAETTTIGGSSYYLHSLSPADGNGTALSASAVTAGRKLMDRWVYPLSGIVSIPASTWTVTYRAMRSASAKNVVAHGDIDILIRKADGNIRNSIASDVANSPSLTLTNVWETLTGTYDWPGYTVVDQTDHLDVAYYIEVTTPQNSKSVRLLVDDGTLPLPDQTKIENVMFSYVNEAPVASLTYSPSNPLIYDTVTFNASASYDPDGSIVSYTWDFGDGNVTTVTDPIITHVYTTAESTVNYTVTLTVTDNEGSTGSVTDVVPVTNPTILHVSLPAGTYFGPNPDHWLSQCWRLNITALSGTFTIRINNTHASFTSDDTHLIIALNNASYEYLESLTVDSTTISKTSFVYGKPEPYGFTLTWKEDVYPTWFSDIYVVGTIGPQSYKDVEVSVTFSNATGVKMHFDAYGSQDSPPPPTNKGHVTHNAHQKDSTVSFWSPPVVEYYLTVKTDPEGITTIPGEGWYINCTYVNLTAPEFVPNATGVNGERYRFDNWTVNGEVFTTLNITVHMDANHTAITHYVKQYYLTVISPYGAPSGMGWYNSSDTAYAKLDTGVVDHENGTRRVFTHWSVDGNAWGTNYTQSDPITMDQNKTAVANWQTQYYLTLTTSSGGATDPPSSRWSDAGTMVSVEAVPDACYVFDHWLLDSVDVGSANPYTVLMDDDHSLHAVFAQINYTLTITATAGGTTDPIPGVYSYPCGSYVSVEAVPDSCYVFDHWELDGLDVGSTNPYSVLMDDDHTLHAVFTQITYQLTITTTSGGMTDPVPGVYSHPCGSSVGVTAIPEAGYRLDHWVLDGSPAGSANPISVVMDDNHDLEAVFAETHTLIITVSEGGTTDPPPGTYIYETPTDVVVEAIPFTDYLFDHWEFDDVDIGSDNPITVYVGSTYTLKAVFVYSPPPPPLSVSISPLSKSILIGDSVAFTSTVSGGTSPYTYQWYLDDNPVSGADESSWTFTPTSTGVYYVYLKVTDANNNTVQSDTARITVTSVPVGGYSVSLTKPIVKTPLICYTILLAAFGALITLIKRKRK